MMLLTLVMAGCSSDDSVIDTPQQPENKNNVVTLTTTVSMDGGATTRALTSGGVKTFAAGETMAVIYNNGTSTVKAVSHELQVGDITNDGKNATFTFDLKSPNTSVDVTYIYPAAMAGNTGVNYSNLYWQDGTLATLASNFDLATKTAAWEGTSLPSATLKNQLAILAITLKDNAETPAEITRGITNLVLSDGTNAYTVSGHDSDGPIYVAIRPTNSADISITATDGSKNYKKSLADKTYEANNGYNVSWRMQESVLPATYYDPQDNEIQDYAVVSWLRLYGFTQADIDALGRDEDATDKLYECWLYNCDFTVDGAGGSVSVINTTSEGGCIKTATVQLTRKAPLGAINGYLYLYANPSTNDELIQEEAIQFLGDNNNPDFPIAPSTGTVTQTATATIDTNVALATTIRATIEVYIPPYEPEPELEGE